MSLSEEYSFVDRALHHAAFSTSFIHSTLDELESDLYRSEIASVATRDEVFVAGLPRAGTTLLLRLLYDTGEFATYTYRHMPFVRAPLLWDRLSRPFQRAGTAKERAHGDGVDISFDSPEAFEEIIWLHHLRDRIEGDNQLATLSKGDGTSTFVDAMQMAIRKLLLLEGGSKNPPLRYLSKNNANMARLDLIVDLFSSSIIVVPFREPLSHISSLLTQHRQFAAHHQVDPFSKRYMKWLGHHDFGENFKPINFDGWLDHATSKSYEDIDFWLEYWLAAYNFVVNRISDNIVLVDYDRLLVDGKAALEGLADRIRLRDPAKLAAAARALREPTSTRFDDGQCSASTLEAAEELHGRLQELALL